MFFSKPLPFRDQHLKTIALELKIYKGTALQVHFSMAVQVYVNNKSEE